ncbi:MAG: CPBP family intramembrane metalloprotease [Candidatus Niyogibacteria bacterium]|nr:CPBP family intramembrane metalloprotease [Candidatus Niyogibacteria bacterium]
MRRWLEAEATGKRMYGLIVAVVLVSLMCSLFAAMILQSLGVELPPVVDESKLLGTPFIPLVAHYIILAVLLEEIIFRFIPLSVAVRMKCSFTKLMAIAIASSVIFGFLHGILPALKRGDAMEFMNGVPFIFIQGVSGFLLSIAFLKCGGYAGKFEKALLASTAIHGLENSIILLLFSSTRLA